MLLNVYNLWTPLAIFIAKIGKFIAPAKATEPAIFPQKSDVAKEKQTAEAELAFWAICRHIFFGKGSGKTVLLVHLMTASMK